MNLNLKMIVFSHTSIDVPFEHFHFAIWARSFYWRVLGLFGIFICLSRLFQVDELGLLTCNSPACYWACEVAFVISCFRVLQWIGMHWWIMAWHIWDLHSSYNWASTLTCPPCWQQVALISFHVASVSNAFVKLGFYWNCKHCQFLCEIYFIVLILFLQFWMCLYILINSFFLDPCRAVLFLW